MATISVPPSESLAIASGLERVFERMHDFLDSASKSTIAAEQLAQAEGLADYLGEANYLDRRRMIQAGDVVDEGVLAALQTLADEMRRVEGPPLAAAARAAGDVLSELDRRSAELRRELKADDDA